MPSQRLSFAIILAITCAPACFADSWKIDPSHSSAQFSVRHMMVSNVRGEFSKVGGVVDYDAKNPLASKIDATIDVASVDTREPKRDEHLKSADFFDTQKFPTMTFVSKKVVEDGPGKLKVTGDLTLHGVTKTVTLEVEGPTKPVKDQHGNEHIGASATGVINRLDYGITWNKNLDGGGVVVGEQIPITIDVELVRNKVSVNN